MGPKAKPAATSTSTPGELSKEIESIGIADLEEKLNRSRRRCKQLEAANKHYQEQFEQLEDDRRDVVTYLKRTLERRGEEVSELQDRLNGLTQTLENERKAHQQQIKQTIAEFEETKDNMAAQITVLNGKLNGLEEFRMQKSELLGKFSRLEAKLEEDEAKNKEELYQLDRKNILEKDRLKKDMLQRVNQIAADFRKVSNKQVADTTKRMMRENVSMSVTLTKISEKTAELVDENRKLKSQYHGRQLKISMLEATEMELMKKNRSHMRIIKLLNGKCNAQELALNMFEDLHEKFLKLLDDIKIMFSQCEMIQNDLNAAQNRSEGLRKELLSVQSQLAESETKRKNLEAIMIEAASVILGCLQLGTSQEPYDKYEAQSKRESLFTQLLSLLCSATGLSESAHLGTIGLFTQIKSYADHYDPGNLGLVSKSKTQTAVDRPKAQARLDFSKPHTEEQCICSRGSKYDW